MPATLLLVLATPLPCGSVGPADDGGGVDVTPGPVVVFVAVDFVVVVAVVVVDAVSGSVAVVESLS